MTMPAQKPHRSVQDVGTPRELLDAIEKRFGPITLDLAATAENKVCEHHFGPGTNLRGGEDTLHPSVSWAGRSLRFLNPPFGNVTPFAQKCAAEAHHAPIALLVPLRITDWFREYLHQNALVLALNGRVTFKGHKAPFPADLVVAVFGPWVAPGFDVWRWRE